MKLVTARQMVEIDRRAIEEIGIPSIVLMENAGLQAVQAMERHFGPLAGKRVCIVCGKGNNGGDGLVVARHLTNRGAKTRIFLLAEKKEIRADAKVNLEIVLSMDLALQELTDSEQLGKLERALRHSDLVVDAIFGTGLHKAPRNFYRAIIRLLNTSQRPLISLDVPTGLSASSGKILGEDCIHAQLTVSFALPKLGLLCSPHRHYVGQLEVVDIGIPRSLTEDPQLKVELLEAKHLKGYFKPRPYAMHKGDFGRVLVLAGSPGKTGAGVMSAQAALRSGAGLVTLGVPRSLHRIVEMKTTAVMTLGLSETKGQALSPLAARQILSLAKQMEAAVIGPGLSTNPKTALLVKELIANLPCPIVLDADGINNSHLASLRYSKAPLIITPHPGEMSHLLEIPSKEVQENRLEAAQKTATTFQVYVGALLMSRGQEDQVTFACIFIFREDQLIHLVYLTATFVWLRG